MRPAFRSAFRRVVVWLLAGLVPLQALAAGIIAVAGPSHTHVPAAAVQLVLDDFRRAPRRPAAAEAHGGGHGHVHATAERHHHPFGDDTVVADPADAFASTAPDDIGASPSLGLFVGLISAPPCRLEEATADRPVARAPLRPRTHHPAFPERPPRAG